jgi:VIT1/CCC1 family predicted Fe2+/Mn2+ transporter
MSNPSPMTDSPEHARRRLQLRGFTSEQAQEVQRLAQAMAQQQVQRAVSATSNFVTTVVTLLSSAVGFVAAFAWNTAIQTWLQTLNVGNGSLVERDFIYAIIATVFAIVVIGVLGFIHGRIKGRNLMEMPGNK